MDLTEERRLHEAAHCVMAHRLRSCVVDGLLGVCPNEKESLFQVVKVAVYEEGKVGSDSEGGCCEICYGKDINGILNAEKPREVSTTGVVNTTPHVVRILLAPFALLFDEIHDPLGYQSDWEKALRLVRYTNNAIYTLQEVIPGLFGCVRQKGFRNDVKRFADSIELNRTMDEREVCEILEKL